LETDGRSAMRNMGIPTASRSSTPMAVLRCRLDLADANAVATESGVRLISADRPGIGLSDPSPGRTVLDWAHDVGELLDQIEVDRFANATFVRMLNWPVLQANCFYRAGSDVERLEPLD
jgi:pimeloyl-ACP methyl ester carboxylesterase